MAKLKHTTRRQRVAPPFKTEKSKYPDAALIRLCVTITAELAAFNGCSGADPDGNNVHAEPIWDRHIKRAHKAIEQAVLTRPTTWAGLASKAVAMTAILNDECGGMEERSESFYRSFADDVERLCKAAVDKERDLARTKATVEEIRKLQADRGAAS